MQVWMPILKIFSVSVCVFEIDILKFKWKRNVVGLKLFFLSFLINNNSWN